MMLSRLARVSLRGCLPRTFSNMAYLSKDLSGTRNHHLHKETSKNVVVADPEIFDIIEKEKRRQRESLCLIPSENFTSTAVLEALGSVMSNKYRIIFAFRQWV